MKEFKPIIWAFVTAIGMMLAASVTLRPAHAIDYHQLESDYTQQKTAAAITSVTTSTQAVGNPSDVGFSFRILASSYTAVGGLSYSGTSAGSFHISWTTATFRNQSTGAITSNTMVSSETFIPWNAQINENFLGAGFNPQFVFSNINANATYYFDLTYGIPKTSLMGQ